MSRSERTPIATERRETYLVMASEKPLDIAGQDRADGLLLDPIDPLIVRPNVNVHAVKLNRRNGLEV